MNPLESFPLSDLSLVFCFFLPEKINIYVFLFWVRNLRPSQIIICLDSWGIEGQTLENAAGWLKPLPTLRSQWTKGVSQDRPKHAAVTKSLMACNIPGIFLPYTIYPSCTSFSSAHPSVTPQSGWCSSLCLQWCQSLRKKECGKICTGNKFVPGNNTVHFCSHLIGQHKSHGATWSQVSG